MNILKTVLSVGAGLLATAACYLFMSSEKKSGNEEGTESSQVNNLDRSNDTLGSDNPIGIKKSDNLLKKLDKFQVGLINFARFVSEVIRAISLFIRAMRCYEYDVSYSS